VAAYRRMAQQHHPDHGGAEDAWHEVSRAYRVLRDPGSRLLYDQTGMPTPPQVDKEARSVLFTQFQQALLKDDADPVQHVRRAINSRQRELQQQLIQMQGMTAKFSSKRDLVKKKRAGDGNVYQELIERELRDLQHAAGRVQVQLDIGARALAMLDDYYTDAPPPPEMGWMTRGYNFNDLRATGTSYADLVYDALKNGSKESSKDTGE
jgi:hypothetical protein